MQSPHHYSRINLAELKAQLVRKLGPEGSKQYFYYLNRLLNLKLSKVEFNKICMRIVGRENILLHNQFIRSILKNACCAKVPPPAYEDELVKHSVTVPNKESQRGNYEENGLHGATAQAPSPATLANGDILPPSPRKVRTGFRDRRAADRRSALGPNGKTNYASHQSTASHLSDFSSNLENGDINLPDAGRTMQHHQGIACQVENEMEIPSHQAAKLSAMRRSPDGPVSVHTKDQNQLLTREDRKEFYVRSPLRAPLGVPFCPVSIGGARRALPIASSSSCVSALDVGALLDSVILRERMEQIAATQGLEGVSVDCANLLNNGLDAYLKGIIRSCIQLVGARSGHEPAKNETLKQQAHIKLVNGVRLGHHYQIHNGGRPVDAVQGQKSHCSISLQDFRVAMELNPQQLGEDWPLLLEKICVHAFEE